MNLAAETRLSIAKAVRTGLDSLRAEPPQHLSEWAAAHFKLAGDSSHQKGAWHAWPFQLGIMDFMSDDRIEEVHVQKSKRVGYTKILTAFIAYNIAHRRRKQAVWQPTDDDRDSFVKSEVDPVLDVLPSIRAARRQGRSAEDTIRYKQFRDSVLHLLGGKAARAYRRITVAVAMLDEWSAFDQVIEKSADPKTLAMGRLEGAPYPKFVGGSTPRIKGLDHVERAREKADVDLRFHIACKHCGADHPLLWGGPHAGTAYKWGAGVPAHGFKWTPGRPETAHHVCPHCRGAITQADYLPGHDPLPGTWVCQRTGLRYGMDRLWRDDDGAELMRPPRAVGVQVWSAYSPQRSWESIAREFEQSADALATGDSGPMQGFVNETLGDTWELVGERVDDHALQKRAEPYALCTVPVGGLKLTAGIDLQGNRWEIGVWAWGRGMESWAVDHQVLQGNPASESDWEQLTLYLQRRYPQLWPGGGTLAIESIAIDSGYHTQAVYHWVRKVQHLLPVRAVKGDNADSKSIKLPATTQDVNWAGKRWTNGVKLWPVGVDAAKDLLHGQLAIEPDPTKATPGCVHFSHELPTEWYHQLTAEQRIPVKGPRGGEVLKWVKHRPRNEVLDCRNYALHAALVLGLDAYGARRWDDLERAVQPPPDLFNRPEARTVTQHHNGESTPSAPTTTTAAERAARGHDNTRARQPSATPPQFARAW